MDEQVYYEPESLDEALAFMTPYEGGGVLPFEDGSEISALAAAAVILAAEVRASRSIGKR